MTISPIDTKRLKEEALKLGFSACGVTTVKAVDHIQCENFMRWLSEGKQAEMHYMGNNVEKRLSPTLLMEGAKSIISLAMNYYPQKRLDPSSQYEFSYYAYGRDYHEVMKERIYTLLYIIRQWTDKEIHARVFCDTAPMFERYWAQQCGIGWIGKNTQLVIPNAGSYFFLGEILIDQPFTHYDTPIKDRCGNCNACIRECPTHALEKPYKLNAARCLSYLTIEYRGETLTPEAGNAMGNCIYGCDRCQKVCPWNRFATPTKIEELHSSEAFIQATHEDMDNLDRDTYRKLFKGSAVKRVKYEGLVRNIQAAKKQK
ncbi:MAG: tRNA epoxyqueuosine(34) reductase QueG [Bacteroidaceae bacterium]|nr:tRNA epoxyqueuosine(34) reductase QueG [Bacteroidaceae bacterium]MBQ8362279.1 tRNA epoxyqueuosine(34) reductase QueG [Bacteroidaceae bacterium]